MQEDMLFFWGWTRNDQSYKELVATAPKHYRIYTLDYADLTKQGWIAAVSTNALQFLNENHLNKVSIMGHSLGGVFALRFAHDHPERVNHMYLLDSCGVYNTMSLLELTKNFLLSNSLYGKRKAGENIKASLRFLKNPVPNIRLAYYSYKIDLQEEAREIAIPTTLIWGEKDHLNPLWQGERLHNLIRGSKIVVLKGMDHDWPLHRPELFWENV